MTDEKKTPPAKLPPIKEPSHNARILTIAHDDGRFIRTGLVIEGEICSIALVNGKGKRLALLNITALGDEGEKGLLVDVIDIDKRYQARRVYGFAAGIKTTFPLAPGGTVVSVDFREK
jgi:hypothetical protein